MATPAARVRVTQDLLEVKGEDEHLARVPQAEQQVQGAGLS